MNPITRQMVRRRVADLREWLSVGDDEMDALAGCPADELAVCERDSRAYLRLAQLHGRVGVITAALRRAGRPAAEAGEWVRREGHGGLSILELLLADRVGEAGLRIDALLYGELSQATRTR